MCKSGRGDIVVAAWIVLVGAVVVVGCVTDTAAAADTTLARKHLLLLLSFVRRNIFATRH